MGAGHSAIRAAAPGHVRNDSAGGGCLTTKVSHSRKHALESLNPTADEAERIAVEDESKGTEMN